MLALTELRKLHFRLLIAADLRMTEVPACHQHTARRGANRRTAVVLCEPRSLRRQLINMRCGNLLLPVTPGFPPSEIIGDDENNIRAIRRQNCGRNR